MSRVSEKSVETERRFSQRGPIYIYDGTYTTKTEANDRVKNYIGRGFKALMKPCKMGTRVYYRSNKR